MSKRTLAYIRDPGHGWLEVPRQLLHDLGIEGDITSYSYVRGPTAYLEEDCDMPRFIEAHREEFPEIELDIQPRHLNHDAPIRRYQRFRPMWEGMTA